MIIPLLPTFWCGLVRQASSLTTDDEQNQCWQGRNDLQARRVESCFRSGLATPGESGDDCWLNQYVLVDIVAM
eukprot:scaffold19368_cov49-Phaeocystis_antarctica.AAC.1